tara:strand:- start:244 stop:600 length:357 start_codon:yes stop_codon:yes gene_type:complete
MNDDAKFFFFLSGFFGFVFFYFFSIFLNRDPILSLVYGSTGSLFFSILGRYLLISALRKVQTSQASLDNESPEDTAGSNTNYSSGKEKNQDVLKTSLKANQEAASSKSADLRSLPTKK